MTTFKEAIQDNGKVNPNIDEKIKKNIGKIKASLVSGEVSAYFVPSPKLREMVLKNDHPVVQKIAEKIKAVIISGEPFYIQNKMVWEYITGVIDENNAFVLNNGEIRIIAENSSGLKSHNSISGE